MDHIQPWERMEGESEEAWSAFQLYRDLGMDRSLARVRQVVGKSNTLLGRWSKRDGWVARCEAFDREQDRLWMLSQAKARREMAVRHVKVANAVMNKVVKRLNKIDPDDLTPSELVKFFEAATKVERLALEQPTRVEITGKDGGPMSIEVGLSDKERRARLEELQKELAQRVGRLPSQAAKVIEGETIQHIAAQQARLALAASDDA